MRMSFSSSGCLVNDASKFSISLKIGNLYIALVNSSISGLSLKPLW